MREILLCRSIPSPAVLRSARIAWWRHSQAQHSHRSTHTVVVVAFVCLLSRFARLPHNPTLYRFPSCELPRRSTSRRPLEPDSRTRSKKDRLQDLSLLVYRHVPVALQSCRYVMALRSDEKQKGSCLIKDGMFCFVARSKHGKFF